MKKFKTFCDCDFKENCKTTVCDCDFYDIFKITVINCGFMIIMTTNIFFYGYYDKEYFKNNIKITILLK